MEFMMRAISTETYFADFKDSLKNFTFLKEDQLKTIIPFESSLQDIFDTQLSMLILRGIRIDGALSFIALEGLDNSFMYRLRTINKDQLKAIGRGVTVDIKTVSLLTGIPMKIYSENTYVYRFMTEPGETNTYWRCPITKTIQHHLQMTVTDIQDKIKL